MKPGFVIYTVRFLYVAFFTFCYVLLLFFSSLRIILREWVRFDTRARLIPPSAVSADGCDVIMTTGILTFCCFIIERNIPTGVDDGVDQYIKKLHDTPKGR